MVDLGKIRRLRGFEVEREVANLHDTILTLRARMDDLQAQAKAHHEEARKFMVQHREDEAKTLLKSWADCERRARDCRVQTQTLESRKQDLIDAKVEAKVLKALEAAKNAQKRAVPYVSDTRAQEAVAAGEQYSAELEETRSTLSISSGGAELEERVSDELERLSRETMKPLGGRQQAENAVEEEAEDSGPMKE